MKKQFFLLAILAFLCTTNNAFAAGPRMELSATTWDFGEVYQWTNPSTSITIRNTGDQDLKILDVKASCGCTAAEPSARVVKPGGEARLKIDFASYNFTKRVAKDVILVTNDPAAPSKSIVVQGFIKEDKGGYGQLESGSLDLGVVAPYETKYFMVSLYNKGNADLPVTGVDIPKGSFLDSALPDRVLPKSSVPVTVGYRPSKQSGPINEEVVFRVAGFGQTELKMKLEGYVSESTRAGSALIIAPAGFKVSKDSPNTLLEFAVKNAGDAPVVIDGAESSLPGTAPAVISGPELAPGESGRVSMTVSKDALKPNQKGYVYLRLALPVTVSGEEKK